MSLCIMTAFLAAVIHKGRLTGLTFVFHSGEGSKLSMMLKARPVFKKFVTVRGALKLMLMEMRTR